MMSSSAIENDTRVETKAEAEALIPLFKLERLLNQDQNGRRISLLGSIKDQPALFILERAAFSSDAALISKFITSLTNTTNLGANDVYRWYMSNHSPDSLGNSNQTSVPDLKLNLIYPCTPTHIRKYSSQTLRYVTETPQIYRDYINPYITRKHITPQRLDWIHNILDGKTEQEDVIYRSPNPTFPPTNSTETEPTSFLLLPDLNWDRKTLTSLHLLALPHRRDLTSLRDLKTSHIPWLHWLLTSIRTAASNHAQHLARAQGIPSSDDEEDDQTQIMDADQVKCYVHYHPTYYHFHIHVVHVMLEPEGVTQSAGKAITLESLIALLETMDVNGGGGGGSGGRGEGEGGGGGRGRSDDKGLDSINLTYFLGEESEFWKRCFERLKRGERVDLLD